VTDIRVPKLNNNDTEYVLVEWLVEDAREVKADQPVAAVETSKAIEELVCEATGVLRHVVPAGAACAPGQTIAQVLAVNGERPPQTAGAPEPTFEPVITAPARAAMERLGVSEADVRGLGRTLVKTADVEALAAGPAEAVLHTLAPAQQAVGRRVSASWQEIPAAYTAVEADVQTALEDTRHLTREWRKLVGLPELVITAIGAAFAAFPMNFAAPVSATTYRRAEAPNVGVTVDLGRGLAVPVIRGVDGSDLEQIAEAMDGIRRTALRGRFREADLEGANITLALHTDPDVVTAVPIVFPGQVCAISLGGARPRLTLDDSGTVVSRLVAPIGLAYDHRFVNGREALLFLRELKTAVERGVPAP
jgi:2-oxoglutarate dehydrogenase E2 component (dihydrolipoamide succinyltransferase)